MTTETQKGANESAPQTSLSTRAARNLATTTKSRPQMEGISPRWLLKALPWVEVQAGTFRVNRRLSYDVGDGRLTFTTVGKSYRVIPRELGELPMLRGLDDEVILEALADRFVQRDVRPGDVVVEAGKPADQIVLVALGKLEKMRQGKYGGETITGTLAEGDYLAYDPLREERLAEAAGRAGDVLAFGPRGDARERWAFTAKAATPGTVLTLDRRVLDDMIDGSPALKRHIDRFKDTARKPRDKNGQAAIQMAAGHEGEHPLPGTFVDYEPKPREYELSVAQTILRVHTRVIDLYNGPMNQLEEQLRLTVEALRETQEHELVNNPDFGLLPSAEPSQRISTRSGPPTPDDMDDLLCRRRKTRFFLAHPRAIAAFGRECSRRGVYPEPLVSEGHRLYAWRGVPVYPCDKIPITESGSTSILAMRTGLDDQGVIGLHQTGIPDEREPSLNVRFMGIDERAVISYLVSVYYSAAVLIPDALGVLENVEIGR